MQENAAILQRLFKYYNIRLFDGLLPFIPIVITEDTFDTQEYFADRSGNGFNPKPSKIKIRQHQIDIASDTWHCHFVHEMTHFWQHCFGYRLSRGYHDKEWSDKMIEIGLMPDCNGKRVGRHVSQAIIKGGKFENALKGFHEEPELNTGLTAELVTSKIEMLENATVDGSGIYYEYKCNCDVSVFSKDKIAVYCAVCNERFQQKQDPDKLKLGIKLCYI